MCKKGLPIVKEAAGVAAQPVAKSVGAHLRVLLGPGDGMPRFYMREFTLEPGGRIPEHSHDSIEHEQYMVEGELTISLSGEVLTASAGHCIYIPAGCAHWYENRTATECRFLCMIPAGIEYSTDWR
jgi:quercetin dioxygenase-like cupin family protein